MPSETSGTNVTFGYDARQRRVCFSERSLPAEYHFLVRHPVTGKLDSLSHILHQLPPRLETASLGVGP